jgi:hypothetical protein
VSPECEFPKRLCKTEVMIDLSSRGMGISMTFCENCNHSTRSILDMKIVLIFCAQKVRNQSKFGIVHQITSVHYSILPSCFPTPRPSVNLSARQTKVKGKSHPAYCFQILCRYKEKQELEWS